MYSQIQEDNLYLLLSLKSDDYLKLSPFGCMHEFALRNWQKFEWKTVHVKSVAKMFLPRWVQTL